MYKILHKNLNIISLKHNLKSYTKILRIHARSCLVFVFFFHFFKRTALDCSSFHITIRFWLIDVPEEKQNNFKIKTELTMDFLDPSEWTADSLPRRMKHWKWTKLSQDTQLRTCFPLFNKQSAVPWFLSQLIFSSSSVRSRTESITKS